MAPDDPFCRIPPDLLEVFEELRRMEPIFHTASFGTTVAGLRKRMAPNYWEVGASRRRYSREFILEMFEEQPPVDAAGARWTCSGYGLQRLEGETYLLTYTLHQRDRVTRRATIWQRVRKEEDTNWRILYHQGTIVGQDAAADAETASNP